MRRKGMRRGSSKGLGLGMDLRLVEAVKWMDAAWWFGVELMPKDGCWGMGIWSVLSDEERYYE